MNILDSMREQFLLIINKISEIFVSHVMASSKVKMMAQNTRCKKLQPFDKYLGNHSIRIQLSINISSQYLNFPKRLP